MGDDCIKCNDVNVLTAAIKCEYNQETGAFLKTAEKLVVNVFCCIMAMFLLLCRLEIL